ncbi:MAG: hypothetical protein KA791_15350, partial [Flavobacteriales bacterium]|nr:hypothetical protein [Flavobacteriales bacterium]
MRKHLVLLLAAIALISGCTNKRTAINTPSVPEDPRWAPIDSLANIGQYVSALTATEVLLAEARTTGDWQQEFRAMMTTARFQQMTGGEDSTIIGAFEARAETAAFPLNALLHSVIAEQYWSYYRDNRWEIMERTPMDVSPRAESRVDMATWTQPQFMEKVIAEYRASLKDADSLKAVPNERIANLLLPFVSERPEDSERNKRVGLRLRPTLFDLLAHRALEVFRNTETRVAEPASRFTLNDARHFGLFEDFAHMRLAHADSTSWELQALHLHRELERAHLSDTKPDALVDNALGRLSFVRERSTLPDKDSLYLKALTTLASRLPQDTCLGDVLMAQAHWHQEMADKYQRLLEGAGAEVPWKQERKQALALCDQVIARYPGSFAAGHAESMRARLLDTELSVQLEEGVLPDAPFKAAVTCRNVPKLWLRLVKDDWSTDEYLQTNGSSDGEKLVERKALREWSISLPDDGDLNAHMTEVAVDGLSFGHYALLISDSATFKPKVDNIAFGRFWVTRLAMTQRWKHAELDLLVVDRGTGAPKPGIGVVSWSRDYREGNVFKRSLENFTTGQDGFVRTRLRGASGSIGWELQDGEDRFVSTQTWIPDDYTPEQPDEPRIFLFTDRAIYRPGQPVMFKGLVTRKSGKSHEVVAGFKTTVELFDVNYQKVDSLSVTSDAYGAFHGTFTAPQGALTGSMTLETPHGSQQIQVEEYERPTFEVTFDPIAGQPKLGQETAVTGLAKSYAGVPLDGARVQWTVKRSARMPWWCGWWYRGWLPWGRSTQVAQGEAECDAQGKFTVKFTAEADDQFPRGADPIFNFTVEASVVDISGETQSRSTDLSLGYKSISIELGLGESLDRTKADSIDV